MSGSEDSDSWLEAGGNELEEKSRLIERRPDMGCLDLDMSWMEQRERSRDHREGGCGVEQRGSW